MKKFDFIGKRHFAYIFSLIIIISSWTIGLKLGPQFGVDFTGGVALQVKFNEKVNSNIIREKLKSYPSLMVQNFGKEGEYLIRVGVSKKEDIETLSNRLKEDIEKNFKNATIEAINVIGPSVSEQLKKKGILAVLYAVIAMGIYIAFRFEPIFALGAVVALIHDVLITIGLLMVLRQSFDLQIIAALLTLIGYSINDTIVVFDRIREKIQRERGKKPFDILVNEAINENLSRTVITSLTTLIVVITLYLFGSPNIKPFALTLLIGVITGTYSSIFIASGIVVDYYKYKKKDLFALSKIKPKDMNLS
ncbi:MAG TPA: protein translocase subunit SecF [Desulfurobacteriaceae bacterium]|nr:protein translocase subunit SecF [Desulfurobacteriaceae bacterium]